MKLFSLSTMMVFAMSVSGLSAAPAAIDVLVYEHSTGTLGRSTMLEASSNYYLPVSFFVSRLDFELKELGGNVIGMCLDDLCIPLPARIHNGIEFVSALDLALDLGGSCIWDRRDKQLFLNIRGSFDSDQASSSPLDFALPSIPRDASEKSHVTHLSEFRGKKVMVFAWASW